MFSAILLNLRKSKAITQTELAKAIGVSSGNVSDWEKGRSKPGYDALQNISKYFDISADALLGSQPSPIMDSSLNADEATILRKFRSLSINDKEEISTMIDMKYSRAFPAAPTTSSTYQSGKKATTGSRNIG